MNRQLAEYMTNDLMSDVEADLTPSMAQTMRSVAMDAFLTTMAGMDADRSSGSPEPSDAAAQAYHRAMNRTTEESHTVGQAKAPAQDNGDGIAFNMTYDGGGNLSGATNGEYVFEIQRDGAGRMKRVIARPR